MKPSDDGVLTSQSCSGTFCSYNSSLQKRTLKEMFRSGSKVHTRCMDKRTPMQTQKLLHKLVKTRALFDDNRNQLLSNTTTRTSENSIKNYSLQRRIEDQEEVDTNSTILQLINFIDKGHASLSECCSFFSCDSQVRLQKHTNRSKRHRRSQTGTQIRMQQDHLFPKNRENKEDHRIGKHNIQHRPKHIGSDPCSCLFNLTGLFKLESKLSVKKLSTKEPKLYFDLPVNQKRETKRGRKLKQAYKKESGMGESVKVSLTKIKIPKRKIKAGKNSSIDNIKDTESKIKETVSESFRITLKKDRLKHGHELKNADLVDVFKSTFDIDPLLKKCLTSRENVVYMEKWACDSQCGPEECSPAKCFREETRGSSKEQKQSYDELKKYYLGKLKNSVTSVYENFELETETQNENIVNKDRKRKLDSINKRADLQHGRKAKSGRRHRKTHELKLMKKKAALSERSRSSIEKQSVQSISNLSNRFSKEAVPLKKRDRKEQTSQHSTPTFIQKPSQVSIQYPLFTKVKPRMPFNTAGHMVEKRNIFERDNEIEEKLHQKNQRLVKICSSFNCNVEFYNDIPLSTMNNKKHRINRDTKVVQKLTCQYTSSSCQDVGKNAKNGVHDPKRCFCKLKLKSRRVKANMPKIKKSITKSIHTFRQKNVSSEPYKCLQIIRAPEECQPVESNKRINLAQRSQSTRSLKSRTVSKNAKALLSYAISAINVKNRESVIKLITENFTKRQAVPVGSTFSFDIEFYVDSPNRELCAVDAWNHQLKNSLNFKKSTDCSRDQNKARHHPRAYKTFQLRSTAKLVNVWRQYNLPRCSGTLKLTKLENRSKSGTKKLASQQEQTSQREYRKLKHKPTLTLTRKSGKGPFTNSTIKQCFCTLKRKMSKPSQIPIVTTDTVAVSKEDIHPKVKIPQKRNIKKGRNETNLEPYKCKSYFSDLEDCDLDQYSEIIKSRERMKSNEIDLTSSKRKSKPMLRGITLLSAGKNRNSRIQSDCKLEQKYPKRKRKRSKYTTSNNVSISIDKILQPSRQEVRLESNYNLDLDSGQKYFETDLLQKKTILHPFKRWKNKVSDVEKDVKSFEYELSKVDKLNKASGIRPLLKPCLCNLTSQHKETGNKLNLIPFETVVMPAQIFYKNIYSEKFEADKVFLSNNNISFRNLHCNASGSKCLSLANCAKQHKSIANISRKKNLLTTDCNRRTHFLQSNPFGKHSFYSMNFQVRHKLNQKYKLEPYECEPGVCVPGQCDPIECQKRIMRRLTRKVSTMTSTGNGSKSISSQTSYFGPNSRSQKQQFRNQYNAKLKGEAERDSLKRETLSRNQQQAVLFGSKQEKQYKSRGTRNYKNRDRDKESQSGSIMHHKESMVTNKHNRCFCTLKLQKRGKKRPGIELKTKNKVPVNVVKLTNRGQNTKKIRNKGRHITDFGTGAESWNSFASCMSFSKPTKGKYIKNTQKVRKFRSVSRNGSIVSRSAQNSAVYRSQNEQVKIKTGDELTNTKLFLKRCFCTAKLGSSDSDKTYSTGRNPSLKSKSTNLKHSKKSKSIFSRARLPRYSNEQEKTREKVKCLTKCAAPEINVLNTGSSKSFDTKFYKDKVTGQYYILAKDFQKTEENDESNMFIRNPHGIKLITDANDGEKVISLLGPESRTDAVKKGHRMGAILKRCFCTSALHKKTSQKQIQKKPTAKLDNMVSRGTDSLSNNIMPNVKSKIRKSKQYNLKPYECEPGVCTPGQCDPYECEKLIRKRLRRDSGTLTQRYRQQTSMTNTYKNKSKQYNLKPYECEPGVCTPGQCDPYECEKLMRKRLRRDSGKLTQRYRLQPSMINTYKNKSKQYNLKPYECEPGVCTPGQCDPYECEKLIRKRRRQDSGTLTQRYRLQPSMTNTYKYKMKNRGAQSIQTYDRTLNSSGTNSQAKLIHHRSQTDKKRTESKASSVGTLMKRCFCTLKLQKTRRQHLKSNDTNLEQKKTTKDVSLTTKTIYKPVIYQETGTNPRRTYPILKPYECEPGTCIPNNCDPLVCYKRIKQRHMKTGTGTTTRSAECESRRMKGRGTISRSVNTRRKTLQTQARFSDIGYDDSKQSRQSYTPNIFWKERFPIPNLNSWQVGSNISFNIEFYKKRVMPNGVPVIGNSNDNAKSLPKRQSIKRTKRKFKGSGVQAEHHTESKASSAGNLLKRCFCTAKWHPTEYMKHQMVTVGRVDNFRNISPFKPTLPCMPSCRCLCTEKMTGGTNKPQDKYLYGTTYKEIYPKSQKVKYNKYRNDLTNKISELKDRDADNENTTIVIVGGKEIDYINNTVETEKPNNYGVVKIASYDLTNKIYELKDRNADNENTTIVMVGGKEIDYINKQDKEKKKKKSKDSAGDTIIKKNKKSSTKIKFKCAETLPDSKVLDYKSAIRSPCWSGEALDKKCGNESIMKITIAKKICDYVKKVMTPSKPNVLKKENSKNDTKRFEHTISQQNAGEQDKNTSRKRQSHIYYCVNKKTKQIKSEEPEKRTNKKKKYGDVAKNVSVRNDCNLAQENTVVLVSGTDVECTISQKNVERVKSTTKKAFRKPNSNALKDHKTQTKFDIGKVKLKSCPNKEQKKKVQKTKQNNFEKFKHFFKYSILPCRTENIAYKNAAGVAKKNKCDRKIQNCRCRRKHKNVICVCKHNQNKCPPKYKCQCTECCRKSKRIQGKKIARQLDKLKGKNTPCKIEKPNKFCSKKYYLNLKGFFRRYFLRNAQHESTLVEISADNIMKNISVCYDPNAKMDKTTVLTVGGTDIGCKIKPNRNNAAGDTKHKNQTCLSKHKHKCAYPPDNYCITENKKEKDKNKETKSKLTKTFKKLIISEAERDRLNLNETTVVKISGDDLSKNISLIYDPNAMMAETTLFTVGGTDVDCKVSRKRKNGAGDVEQRKPIRNKQKGYRNKCNCPQYKFIKENSVPNEYYFVHDVPGSYNDCENKYTKTKGNKKLKKLKTLEDVETIHPYTPTKFNMTKSESKLTNERRKQLAIKRVCNACFSKLPKSQFQGYCLNLGNEIATENAGTKKTRKGNLKKSKSERRSQSPCSGPKSKRVKSALIKATPIITRKNIRNNFSSQCRSEDQKTPRCFVESRLLCNNQELYKTDQHKRVQFAVKPEMVIDDLDSYEGTRKKKNKIINNLLYLVKDAVTDLMNSGEKCEMHKRSFKKYAYPTLNANRGCETSEDQTYNLEKKNYSTQKHHQKSTGPKGYTEIRISGRGLKKDTCKPKNPLKDTIVTLSGHYVGCDIRKKQDKDFGDCDATCSICKKCRCYPCKCPPYGAKFSLTGKKDKPKPCVCRSSVCSKERKTQAKKIAMLRKTNQKPCICKNPSCKKISNEDEDCLWAKTKQYFKPEKICICKAQGEKDKICQCEKIMAERRRKEFKKLRRKYEKEDALRLKERIAREKEMVKQAKSFKSSNNALLFAESVLDIGKLGFTAAADVARSTYKTIKNPAYTCHEMKSILADPKRGLEVCKKVVKSSAVITTFKRIQMRLAAMSCVKAGKSILESYAVTNYLLHAADKDPKKRMHPKKRRKIKKREPIDFNCSLYMGTLKKKPFLALYYMFPKLYPHWISFLRLWRQISDIGMFLLAVLVWSPCIFAMEICRAFMCCCLCGG